MMIFLTCTLRLVCANVGQFFESLYTVCIDLYSGTPEIGGLTTIQALELLRGCQGLNIVGGDVTEVSFRIIFGSQ